ncbi:MAG: VCBS repeat-containing protein, partial [Lentisphaerae bacterium]|nr:VCBS repeat-containing protein [Lentisphaerota bacterium]
GGLRLHGLASTTNRFNNNIFYFNTGPGGASSNFTIVSNGVIIFASNCSTPSLNGFWPGNITNDPAFVNKDSGNYRLRTNSPCINQGVYSNWMDGTFDLDGNARIILNRVDMGAYEFTHPYPYLTLIPTNITNAIFRGRTSRTLLTITNAEGSNALSWIAWTNGTWIEWNAPTGGALVPWEGTNFWVTNSALTNLPGAYIGSVIVAATNNNYPNYDTITTVVTFVMQVMELQKTPDQLTNAVVMQGSWTTNSFQLWNAGPGVINYTISTNQPWLVLSQSVGSLTGETDFATNTIIVTYTNTVGLTVGEQYGTLTIASTNGGGVTNTLAVTLTVRAMPMLGTTPAQLTNVVMTGQNAASQTIQVWNASAYFGIGYRITTNGSWLSVAVTNNYLAPLTTNHFAVQYAVSSLTQPGDVPSNYSGTITVTATNEASGSPAQVPVSMRINPKPRMALSLASLSQSVLQGRDASSQEFEVWNANGFYTLSFTNTKNAAWLVPTPLSATSTGQHARITVQYSTLNLLPGISNAVITIVGRVWGGTNWDNAVAATQQIAVAMTVVPIPTLATDAQAGYAYRVRKGVTPEDTVVHVWNGSTAPRASMNYTSTPSASWLSISPTAGASTGELDEVRVAVDASGMDPWVTYSGTVRIDATEAGSGVTAYGSPQTFAIEVVIYEVKGFDFQGAGSGASDLVVYRESSGQWAIRNLLSEFATNVVFGGAGFQAVPGDYNGDGVTELALYRPGSGSWYAWAVGAETIQALEMNAWIGSGYVGVPGDYDGDGKLDPAVYLEASGLWMGLLSGSAYQQASGALGGEGYAPLPAGDYDGDGQVDPGVYHRTTGLWIVFFSSSATVVSGTFGGSGFVLVPSDYDADDITDPALFETATGRWYVLPSTTLTAQGYGLAIYQIWGVVPAATFVPAPGDYDGDGRADLALYDTTTGYWYILTLDGVSLAWGLVLGGVGYVPIVP